jgi:hypothetical protein
MQFFRDTNNREFFRGKLECSFLQHEVYHPEVRRVISSIEGYFNLKEENLIAEKVSNILQLNYLDGQIQLLFRHHIQPDDKTIDVELSYLPQHKRNKPLKFP